MVGVTLSGHFSPSLLYAAACSATPTTTQAEVAAQPGTSRASVSRLLDEAKRRGIVRIEVVPPAEAASGNLADRLTRALGLTTGASCLRNFAWLREHARH